MKEPNDGITLRSSALTGAGPDGPCLFLYHKEQISVTPELHVTTSTDVKITQPDMHAQY